MDTRGKRVAILVEDDFEDSELLQPLEALKDAGIDVVLVGTGDKQTYHGKKGATVQVDTSASEISGHDFDAVVVPGGYAPDKLRLNPNMIRIVREMNGTGRIVAAVCHGPQLLISADVVRGRTVTSWPSVAVDLKNAGANFVDKPVVVDGNLITSRKPDDLPQFSAAIIDALLGKRTTQTRMGI
jgi:protease I